MAVYYVLEKYSRGREDEKKASLFIANGKDYGEEYISMNYCKDGVLHFYTENSEEEISASWALKEDGTIVKKVFKKFHDDFWFDAGKVLRDSTYDCRPVEVEDTAALADKALKELAQGPTVPHLLGVDLPFFALGHKFQALPFGPDLSPALTFIRTSIAPGCPLVLP